MTRNPNSNSHSNFSTGTQREPEGTLQTREDVQTKIYKHHRVDIIELQWI